ncbi:MAG: replication initiator protein [Microvirus sp.]|nr:MAG: replication initiator protein [Microvirus sp.]
MACEKPWRGYRWPDGTVRAVPGPGPIRELPFEIACAKCLSCRIEKGRQWALRCQHEASQHKHPDGGSKNCFLTLTYDSEHLPENMSVDKTEWQLFADRLRKKMGKFRYLHVGEYGEENKRPHYHALIFGLDFSEDREWLSTENGNPYYVSPTIGRLWKKGFHIVAAVTPETINYVCRYTQKKILGTSSDAQSMRSKRYERVSAETGEVWMVEPEYATMSLKPGIGSAWWDKYKGDLFPDDFAIYQGKKMKTPKFYLDKHAVEDKEGHAAVKKLRAKYAASKAADNTPERRKVKAAITQARSSLSAPRKLDT